MTAVIMAGGEGVRCRPLTLDTPKPMLKVGGVPVLETIIRQLVKGGVTRIFIVVGYLQEQIIAAVPEWARTYGIQIGFLIEPVPYGTAGGLSLIPEPHRPTESFFVVNADILCPIDFADLMRYHIAEGDLFTLVGREHAYTLPYGYPEIIGERDVINFLEKPTFTYRVNSGMYVLRPAALSAIPPGPYDMPDVIRWACRRRGWAWVGMYPLTVPFHEIGTPESYHAAEAFYERWMR